MLMEHAGDVTETVTISFIEKYVRLHDAYLSVVEAVSCRIEKQYKGTYQMD